jgi:DNA-binding LacI/PurR family transcriptional regulator
MISTMDDSTLLVVDRVERELRRLTSTPGARLPYERDLAVQLGVSRHSVREAMARLKRDNLIRSIPGKGTFTLADGRGAATVHLMTKENYIYSMIFIGVISEILRENGYTAQVICSPHLVDEWQKVSHRPGPSLGGILIGTATPQEVKAMAGRNDLPLVHVSDMLEPFRSPPQCDTVLNDNREMGVRAACHLAGQGHRAIVLIGWGEAEVWDNEMFQGICDGLRAHGIEPDSAWHVRLPRGEDSDSVLRVQARRQVEGWSRHGNAPTALVYSADNELRGREAIEEFFGDRFGPGSTLAVSFWEMLQSTYKGRSGAVAVCTRFRDLGERALEILQRRQNDRRAPATREFHGRVFLARRENGLWKESTS